MYRLVTEPSGNANRTHSLYAEVLLALARIDDTSNNKYVICTGRRFQSGCLTFSQLHIILLKLKWKRSNIKYYHTLKSECLGTEVSTTSDLRSGLSSRCFLRSGFGSRCFFGRSGLSSGGGSEGISIGSIVSNKRVHDQLATSVGVEIILHVITLEQHILTELVKGGGTDHVALTINLPGDGSVLRAHFVVTGGSSGGSSVVVNIGSHVPLLIDDHTTHHIGVEETLVVHHGEDLAVNTNVAGNVLRINGNSSELFHREVAENSIVEGSLVLVDSAAISNRGVGPVNFVGLSDFHVGAVLPVIGLGELLVLLIVVVAMESTTDLLSSGSKVTVGPTGTLRLSSAMRSITVLVVLTI